MNKNYPYSAFNRLEKPHTYMYTPDGGYHFLNAYVSERLNRIDAIARVSKNYSSDQDMLIERSLPVFYEAYKSIEIKPGLGFEKFLKDYVNTDVNAPRDTGDTTELSDFSMDCSVCTQDLILSLIEAWLSNCQNELSMCWMNRLIQRFEVTKKLYARYLPGFRKGEGPYADIVTYWQLAICLALAHARSGHSKYLSTLLKIIDLLLSLPAREVKKTISVGKMKLVVAAELFGVLKLARLKEVVINVE